MLIFHIIIASLSILLSTYLIARPSKQFIRVSYGLISATTLTGIALMVANPAYALRGCIAYAMYSVAVIALIARANKRIASQEVNV